MTPAKIIKYYDFKPSAPIACTACDWSGLVEALDQESYSELFDASCPKCGKMLLIIPYPTADEIKAQYKGGNMAAEEDYTMVQLMEVLRAQVDEKSLKSVDELPHLRGKTLKFEWDYKPGKTDEIFSGQTIIRCGKRVIWNEPAIYEGLWRFNEVKAILKQKYNTRFHSLIPTAASELYLYGDDTRAYREITFT